MKDMGYRTLGWVKIAGATVLVSMADIAFANSVSPENLVLWNRLGSEAEVVQSAAGPGGTLTSGAFMPGVFGNAYVAKYWEQCGVTFPHLPIGTRVGCVEFWAKLIDFPVIVQWGEVPCVMRLRDTVDGTPQYDIMWSGNDGAGGGGLCGRAWNAFGTGPWNNPEASYGPWTYEQVLGSGETAEWHHYALVWDSEGIPSAGGYRGAIYLDGQLNSTHWEQGDVPYPEFDDVELCLLVQQPVLHLTQGSVAYDNLKVWNSAKTDFSDRFDEFPPCGLSCPPDIVQRNDPGECGAVVTFSVEASPWCGVVCEPPSGSLFPVGDTLVLCQTESGASCEFNVRVIDTEAPIVRAVPTGNPSGRGSPNAAAGFFELTGSDNCGAVDVYIGDSQSGVVFGPFDEGIKVKLTKVPGGSPAQLPMGGGIAWHFKLVGDARVYGLDGSGNQSAIQLLKLQPVKK